MQGQVETCPIQNNNKMPKTLTRKSKIRLKGYDYSQTNHYFVTICTNNRTEWFGKIKNNEMVLNNYGNIIKQK